MDKLKDINNESEWDRHIRHMESINKARIKKRGKMNQVKTETWVQLYSELASYILHYSSLDPVYTTDKDGNEIIREEKQEQYLDLTDVVESIMRESGLVKEG